ncbi:MAG: DUF4190 domain-containing protein [Verrucomicrobiota bacterium]
MSGPADLKPSTSARWSLILGIASIVFCWIFASVPAIVLGFIALGKTAGPDPELSGKDTAKAGIATGCIGTIVGLFSMGIWLAILSPEHSMEQARSASDSIELVELSQAISIYSINEGTYPPTLEALLPLYLPGEASLTSKVDHSYEEEPYLYRLDGFRSDNPATSPVVLAPSPLGGSYGVIYADGQVSTTNDQAILDLFD